ncbi:baseplate assembly protein, partial [Amaricoccus sp. HAR-UPW-R2A-40]
MSGFGAIDLSRLPPPDVVERLDFETILGAMKADLIARAPDLAPALALESEPAVKILEVAAYRELLLRARINDAARAVMIATATGADLDHLAALFGVARFVLDP